MHSAQMHWQHDWQYVTTSHWLWYIQHLDTHGEQRVFPGRRETRCPEYALFFKCFSAWESHRGRSQSSHWWLASLSMLISLHGSQNATSIHWTLLTSSNALPSAATSSPFKYGALSASCSLNSTPAACAVVLDLQIEQETEPSRFLHSFRQPVQMICMQDRNLPSRGWKALQTIHAFLACPGVSFLSMLAIAEDVNICFYMY